MLDNVLVCVTLHRFTVLILMQYFLFGVKSKNHKEGQA